MFCSFIMMIMMLLISLILWTRLTTHFQLNKLSLRCAQNNLNFHEVLTWFLSSTTTFNLTPVHFINKELKRFEPPTFPRYVEHKNCICDTIDFLTILLTDPDIAAWSNWVKSVTRTKMLTFHKAVVKTLVLGIENNWTRCGITTPAPGVDSGTLRLRPVSSVASLGVRVSQSISVSPLSPLTEAALTRVILVYWTRVSSWIIMDRPEPEHLAPEP